MTVFVTQYNPSPKCRALSQVVTEKSFTEKKITDKQTNRQTNIITEKAKTICPLYTSYQGYNKSTTTEPPKKKPEEV